MYKMLWMYFGYISGMYIEFLILIDCYSLWWMEIFKNEIDLKMFDEKID